MEFLISFIHCVIRSIIRWIIQWNRGILQIYNFLCKTPLHEVQKLQIYRISSLLARNLYLAQELLQIRRNQRFNHLLIIKHCIFAGLSDG